MIHQFKQGDQLELIDPQSFEGNSWMRAHRDKLIVDSVFIGPSGEQAVMFQGRLGIGYYAYNFRYKFSFIDD